MSAEAERAAIEEMVAKWLEAMNQSAEAGADGYAAFVTEDAVFLPPNSERLDGRAALREMALSFTSLEGWEITWKPTRIDVAEDGAHAHVIGEFELSAIDPDGNAVSDRGKFFDALEKQGDGSWLCSVACWNSSLPAS